MNPLQPDEPAFPLAAGNPSLFLIPPGDRVQFIGLLTALTALFWAFRFQITNPITLQITGTFFDNGLIWGLLLGTMQWLLLRRYIPSKTWILVTTLGWAFSMGFQGKFIEHWASLLFFGFLGGCQWLVLRRYVKHSWVWIFVPVLPMLPIVLFAKLSANLLFTQLFMGRPSLFDVFTGVVIGIMTAIGFCSLRKKTPLPTI
jgi:hypothetical protein